MKSKFLKLYNLILESININGDLFEKEVAKNIDNYFKSQNLEYNAQQTTKGTLYSDIEIFDGKGNTVCFIEAKFNHKANLYSKRLNVIKGEFVPFKENQIGQEICNLMNQDPMSQQFLTDLAKFLNIEKSDINLYSSAFTPKIHGDLKIISRNDLVNFFIERQNKGLNKYIFIQNKFNVTDTLIRHYTDGKAFPANYLQVDDDFYKLSENNVIKFEDVPNLKDCGGSGYLKIRIRN